MGQAQYESDGHDLQDAVNRILEKKPRLRRKYQKPDESTDRLYQSHVVHPSNAESCDRNCGDDTSLLVSREPRGEDDDSPTIHYGLIASANQLMKDAIIRDKLVIEKEALCFEMEAAGLMTDFPCLVIKGIYDYSDSHKNKNWQGYAAMTAAAYAKDLLGRIAPQQLERETRISDSLQSVITDTAQSVNRVQENLDLSQIPTADGAEFDSHVDQHESHCLPGTRTELIADISRWATSIDGKCIFWLNGMAGTGKSTISRTLAKSFKESKVLGASFFFKRGENNRSTTRFLIPTITRQIMRNHPAFRVRVLEAIQKDPDLAARGLIEQFDKFLLQPLLELSDQHISPMVIVIDALDECEVEEDIRVLIRLLPRLEQSKSFSLRILLTSRPEIPIRLGFSELRTEYEGLVLHKIPEEVTARDILLFLRHEMCIIRAERKISLDWPSERELQTLVDLSIPLFIFAATVCRICQDYQSDPMRSLSDILASGSRGSQLDRTYLPVLTRILNTTNKRRVIQEFGDVVGTIILLESPLSVPSISSLIGVPKGVIDIRLDSLHSVIQIPDRREMPVRLFHLSFRDFLLDEEAKDKTPLWVNEKDSHRKLALKCLSMCRELKRNMLSFSTYGTRPDNIDLRTIGNCLPPEQQYSCRFWVHHLVRSTDPRELIHEALQFLQGHFLHWLEAMNWLGLGTEVLAMINLLQSIECSDKEVEFRDFVEDTKRFTLRNQRIAESAPLQIYSSGLLFAPRKALIRSFFHKEFPPWVKHATIFEETWGTELQILEPHIEDLSLLVFSHDGQLLASGSAEGEVCIWDAITGVYQQTLLCFPPNIDDLLEMRAQAGDLADTGYLTSITFSPDNRQLVGSFHSYGICVWDLDRGELIGAFPNSGISFAFSPNGSEMACALPNGNIQLGDSLTGEVQQTIDGHSNQVAMVAISSNGRLIASGSKPRSKSFSSKTTLYLWNTATDTTYEIEDSNSVATSSMAFSSDGQILGLGDKDGNIRLWDTTKKAVQQELQQTLYGHSKTVEHMTFSTDGRLLASISYDGTIKIWNLSTGGLWGSLVCSSLISCVALSPDGRLLATCPGDSTVRIHDISANFTEQQNKSSNEEALIDFESTICSIAVSHDGQTLFSGARDGTIRIWDIDDRKVRQTLDLPKGLPHCVYGLYVSPDDQLLASIWTHTSTIGLWDTITGALRHILKPKYRVSAMKFSNNCQILASISSEHWRFNGIRLWNVHRGKIERVFQTSGHRFDGDFELGKPTMSFSFDDNLLATALNRRSVHLWDIKTSSLIYIFERPGERDICYPYIGGLDSKIIAFSHNGQFLATQWEDNTVRLWNTSTGSQHQTLFSHPDAVILVDFSPDGQLLATTTFDGRIRIWNIKTGEIRQAFESQRLIHAMKFSQDSSFLDTNLRSFRIRPLSENHPSQTQDANMDVYISQSGGDWIELGGERLLWLPLEYRPMCVLMLGSHTLIIGHNSGKVSFIEFDFSLLSVSPK